jgi:hypothetical protein
MFTSQRYIDDRSGEIVTQIPLMEIAHFDEYNGPLQAGDVKLPDAKPEPEADPLAAAIVGAIFVYTWGYDQTNAYFYEVVKRTPKSVMVRRLEAIETPDPDGFMTGQTVPQPGQFCRDQFQHVIPAQRKALKAYRYGDEAEPMLTFDYGVGTLWNGEPVRVSHYA